MHPNGWFLLAIFSCDTVSSFNNIRKKTTFTDWRRIPYTTPWASCQIRKIVGCACAGNAGNVFPSHRGLAIPTCITARAWRTCRAACRDRLLAVSFEVDGGENVPGIPDACATHNFTYLVRGPLLQMSICPLRRVLVNWSIMSPVKTPVYWSSVETIRRHSVIWMKQGNIFSSNWEKAGPKF